MKKGILFVSALFLLMSCGGGAPSVKKDEKGHNPHPSQIVDKDSLSAKADVPVPADSCANDSLQQVNP